jgi:hypothetical protein
MSRHTLLAWWSGRDAFPRLFVAAAEMGFGVADARAPPTLFRTSDRKQGVTARFDRIRPIGVALGKRASTKEARAMKSQTTKQNAEAAE